MSRPGWISAPAIGHALLMLCTLGVIWGVAELNLRSEYHRALDLGTERTENLAQTFDETITRAAEVIDSALRFSREAYLRDPGHFDIAHWMRDKSTLIKFTVNLSIANANGVAVTTSIPGAPEFSISDREHFMVHAAADAPDRLFVSKPVTGRASHRLSIQFTRRIANPDGSFAGVVVASFDPLVLSDFQKASQASGGFAILIGFDGVVRASEPDAALIGDTYRHAGFPDALTASTGGVTELNGTELINYRRVPGFDLYVAAGFPLNKLLASYDEGRRNTLLGGTALSLAVLFVGLIAMQHRLRLNRFHRAMTVAVENISQGIMMIDAKRRIPVANRRVAALLDIPLKLISPGAAYDGVVNHYKANAEAQARLNPDKRVAAMMAGGGLDPNITFYERVYPNGLVLEVRTHFLPDGAAVRTFTDVTERKQTERDLADARDAAEVGLRARNEFLAVMSHEIRTPMNGIIGAAGLLEDMRLGPEQKEYLRIIKESSTHLSVLVQDILDLSRLDAGRLELEEIAFDPRALIQGTIEMLVGQANAKGLYLTSRTEDDVPIRVVGDSSRLRQVLVNLIGNGIKFTDTGGISIETTLIESGTETVSLGVAVTDSGIGIDEESQKKLFFAFSQADSSISRRFGGTGLGLAISRHLIGLMDGTITVDSTPGLGSTFRFTVRLKCAPDAPAAEAVHEEPPSTHRPLKILLAEDNATNRHIATRMLIRMGHAVEAVADGAQAVRALEASEYDVILMDMMMPVMDGLTATRQIRASAPPRCDTIIIGVTANAQTSDQAACDAAGMNGFVTKPVTMARLRASLEGVSPRELPETPEPAELLLDLAFLDQLADEIGPDGAAEVMLVFLEEGPGRMAEIERGMTEGRIPTVRREAHALAGAARNVGLTRLGEAAYAVQRACEGSGPDAASVAALAGLLRETLPLAARWAKAHEGLVTASG